MSRLTALFISIVAASPAAAQVRANTWNVPGLSTQSGAWVELPGSRFGLDAGSGGILLFFSGTLSCTGTGDPCAQFELQQAAGAMNQWSHIEASASSAGGATRIFGFDYAQNSYDALHLVARVAGAGGTASVSDIKMITLDIPTGSGLDFQETPGGNGLTINQSAYQPLLTAHAKLTTDHLVLANVTSANAPGGIGLRIVRTPGDGSVPDALPGEGNRAYLMRNDSQFTSWTFSWYGPLAAGDTVTVEGIASPRVDGGAPAATVSVPETRILLLPGDVFSAPTNGATVGAPVHFDGGTSATMGGNTFGVFNPGDYFLMLRSVSMGLVGARANLTSRVNGVVSEVSTETRYNAQKQFQVGFVDIVRTQSPMVRPELSVIGVGPAAAGFIWDGLTVILPLTLGTGGPTLVVNTSPDGGALDGGAGGGAGGTGGAGGGATDAGDSDAGLLDDGGFRSSDGGLPDSGFAPHSYAVGCGCFSAESLPTTWIGLGIWLGARRRKRATFGGSAR